MGSGSLTVQAGFGYSPVASDITWTDITGRVVLSATEGITITRGAADELADIQTGTLRMTLANDDGALTPGRASSPYYPNVRRNCPLRVITTVRGGKNYLAQPGFEVDDASWEAPWGAAPHNAGPDTTHVKSGTFAHKIEWEAAGTGGILQCPLYGLTIGVPYTASVYVWVPAGDPAVRLDIDGATIGSASTITGNWQRISVTWTTTAAAHTLRITTTTTSPVLGDMVWMDEGQVEEGSSPTAWSSTAATHHPRFYGMVTNWPVTWHGLDSRVALVASDIMKWLSRRPALGPMLVEEIQGDEAKLYYPLSEPESSTSGGDQSGYARPSMTIKQSGAGGTLTFGSGVGPPSDELPTPVFSPSSASAGKYLQCLVAPLLTSSGSTGNPIPGDQVYEAWFSTSTSGRVIMTWSAGFAAAFDNGIRFHLESGTGKLQITEFYSFGPTTITVATPNLADGNPHHLVWDEAGHDVWVDGVQYAVATSTWQDRIILTVGATETGGSLWAGAICHVAAYVRLSGFPAVSEIVEHYAAGMTGHAGESSWIRAYRLAGYAKIPGVIPQGTFSAVASQGTLGSSPLSHLQDIERTENGRLFADRATPRLVFASRSVRYNPTVLATLSYADLETDGVQYSDDDQKQVNLVTATRPGGATQRVQDPDSIALDGVAEQQLTLLKTTDAEVVDAATWLIIRFADPQPEIRQIPVQAATLPLATYRALLNADISSAITVLDLPDEAPTPTATSTVEGYVEQIRQAQHNLDFYASRADLGAVWVLDDPIYSVLGTTTRLAY
ncbi:hypothetical protein EAO70_09320 [Streptomyces sp. adm13(2018)]|uniref:LamG domain-containing protein n=1 Tax=Streptomyces sp. adm13(2018) TaxID=2479007 RepID=UPI0011CD93E8|nr:LamG domain-containing protein [Streptomyces sp. adm13(2018)]TXS20203.1 hypothetical protein EAO70_09320 [Streptomyces sp. adm13(2018)]